MTGPVRWCSTFVAASGLLVLPLTTAVRATRMATQLPHAPGRLVDIGGQGVHLDCNGRGSPTVVFGNGAGDFSLVWSPCAAARRRIHAGAATTVRDTRGATRESAAHVRSDRPRVHTTLTAENGGRTCWLGNRMVDCSRGDTPGGTRRMSLAWCSWTPCTKTSGSRWVARCSASAISRLAALGPNHGSRRIRR